MKQARFGENIRSTSRRMPSWPRNTAARHARSKEGLTHIRYPRHADAKQSHRSNGHHLLGARAWGDAVQGCPHGRDLLWYFVRNETNALCAQGVAELESMGYEILALVVDGRRGLPVMFPDKKVQLCQFHQQKTVRKYLTEHPKTDAAKVLKMIVDMLTRTDKESFEGMFDEWCVRWDDYLKERSTDPGTERSHYTHKRLRSAYLSVRRNLPLLYTWYDNIEMGIPNTTNLIDGHFSQLKRMLRSHNGLKRERREKLVIGFFEASRSAK